MKVLILSHMFPRREDDWNGIFVFEQVKALRAIGIDARVIYGDANWHARNSLFWKIASLNYASAISTEWEAFKGVPIGRFLYHVSVEPLWHKVAPITYQLGVSRLMRRLLKSFQPDVVHAHTALLDGNAALAVARKLKKPYIITEHTGPFSLFTSRRVSRWIARRAVEKADKIVAVSRSLKWDMLGQLGLPADFERVAVIPNGVDTTLFHPAPNFAEGSRVTRFLWVGGFVPIKQPLLAIEAFADAAKLNPDLTLTMIGGGELEEKMRASLRDHGLVGRVDIQGSLGRNELAAVYRQHDCLLITSSSETFSVVALEAIASGIPVLTTACGGPIDTVGGSTRGLIVANDRSEIANGILSLASRSSSAASAASISAFASNYGFDKLAEQLNEIYSDLYGSSK